MSDNDTSRPALPERIDSHQRPSPPRCGQLVTAMERYGEWSKENTGALAQGRRRRAGTGKVGDQFVGINRRDGNEWKALSRSSAGRGAGFAFVTGGRVMNLVLWRYQLERRATAPG